MPFLRHIFIITLILISSFCQAQKPCEIKGKLANTEGEPFELVNVTIKDTTIGTTTNENGEFSLTVACDKSITLVFYHVGFERIEQEIDPWNYEPINIKLAKSRIDITGFTFTEEGNRASSMQKIDPRVATQIPTFGNFEKILTAQAVGVSSNNELSSQYSVRGGNFDENLVYVNDIQIYRPFLIRSGQQEGLSFINANLVSNVLFSSGGFEAKYGDKLSSVLDVTYKEPEKFAGSVQGSLLGGSIHLEDASENHRFTQLHGVRYKTNQYILDALPTTGNYTPVYIDYQTYITYDITDDIEIGFLGNISQNKYQFKPESRQSDFGTINQALRLTVFFEGQEIDEYLTMLGATSLSWKPTFHTELKFIGSVFNTVESETFDILGQYRLDELEKDISKEDFGDAKFNLGVGSFLDHARNSLNATIYNFQHRGTHNFKKWKLLWGGKIQHEKINDKYNEWTMMDSAGFSLPIATDKLELFEFHRSTNSVTSQRYSAYAQANKSWVTDNEDEINLRAGVRANYWSLNKQFIVSPRLTGSYKPKWKRDFLFRGSVGVYQQPPFYRELRNLDGVLNFDIKAQSSMHYVLASDYNFKLGGKKGGSRRSFKLVNEIYYKDLVNLIPYEIDNVRIRYYATNNAVGRAYGIDTKLNGELVEGIDSWVSLSVMKIEEDITDDYYYNYYNATGEQIYFGYTIDDVAVDSIRFEPGYIPRPTDQIFNIGLFFQDYIPKHPEYKVHLYALYGSGLPTGPPSLARYKDTLRIPSYRRVDIGFSRQLLKADAELSPKNPFRHFKTIWISFEVFNLLQINNTISYLWIKDSFNRQFAIPNYLTARRFNLKLIMNF